jgi:hypothetical protein
MLNRAVIEDGGIRLSVCNPLILNCKDEEWIILIMHYNLQVEKKKPKTKSSKLL